MPVERRALLASSPVLDDGEVKSRKLRGDDREQRAESREQRAASSEQRATSEGITAERQRGRSEIRESRGQRTKRRE
jgi:hypothetical protein